MIPVDEQVQSTTMTHQPRRRKSNERVIQDSVVTVGSLMFLASFVLMLETNLRDNGWQESRNTRITICSYCLAIVVFSLMFGLYFWSRIRKTCRRQPEENISVSYTRHRLTPDACIFFFCIVIKVLWLQLCFESFKIDSE